MSTERILSYLRVIERNLYTLTRNMGECDGPELHYAAFEAHQLVNDLLEDLEEELLKRGMNLYEER